LHFIVSILTEGLKNNKNTALYAWLLLICFIGGQYMVYVHQHNIVKNTGNASSVSKNQPRPPVAVQEKCYMCDAMHHTAMTLSQHSYFNPIVATEHVYTVGDYDFISIALILSSGRAPPAIA
jgi:hypothetical protein